MEVRFLNGGYCRQLQAFVDRRTWRMTRFHAVFLAILHPARGWVLVDTGYSTHFIGATDRLPGRLYRWATPVTSTRTTSDIVRDSGIDPDAIADIVLTHFHADHIGGVRDFPRARFHFASDALEPLRALGSIRQTLHAFLPDLLPADFESRAGAIHDAEFRDNAALGLPAADVFGDGSILLVRLPGHAPGHCGVFLSSTNRGPILYAADAFWHHREIDEATRPLPPARMMLHDGRAYEASKAALRNLAQRRITVLACHCPKTQIFIGPNHRVPGPGTQL